MQIQRSEREEPRRLPVTQDKHNPALPPPGWSLFPRCIRYPVNATLRLVVGEFPSLPQHGRNPETRAPPVSNEIISA